MKETYESVERSRRLTLATVIGLTLVVALNMALAAIGPKEALPVKQHDSGALRIVVRNEPLAEQFGLYVDLAEVGRGKRLIIFPKSDVDLERVEKIAGLEVVVVEYAATMSTREAKELLEMATMRGEYRDRHDMVMGYGIVAGGGASVRTLRFGRLLLFVDEDVLAAVQRESSS